MAHNTPGCIGSRFAGGVIYVNSIGASFPRAVFPISPPSGRRLGGAFLSRLKPFRHQFAQLGAFEAASQGVDDFKMRAFVPLVNPDPVEDMRSRSQFDLHIQAAQLEETLQED